jgi:hypothetical protein
MFWLFLQLVFRTWRVSRFDSHLKDGGHGTAKDMTKGDYYSTQGGDRVNEDQ